MNDYNIKIKNSVLFFYTKIRRKKSMNEISKNNRAREKRSLPTNLIKSKKWKKGEMIYSGVSSESGKDYTGFIYFFNYMSFWYLNVVGISFMFAFLLD